MQLPEGAEDRGYLEWSFLIRGMVQVWELARLVGEERKLEEQLRQDRTGVLFEVLGKAGNECSRLTALLEGRLETMRRDGDGQPSPLPALQVLEGYALRAAEMPAGRNGHGASMVA